MKRLLALVFILTICLCLFSCGEESDVPAGMKLASNTEIVDYKLFVPENWIVSESTRAATQAFASESDRTNIIVNQWNITDTTRSIEDWWKNEYKPQVFEAGAVKNPDIKKDSEGKEGSNITLGGKAAVKYEYVGMVGDTYFKYDVIGCIANGSIYVIHITYMEDGKPGEEVSFSTVESRKTEIEAMITNFRFE